MTASAAKQARDTEDDTAIVTKTELVELRECDQDCVRAALRFSKLEKERELLYLSLVEKVLGLKSKDALKVLPLERVEKLFARRRDDGLWEPGKGAPVFAFELTSARRYPAWKELFVGVKGEAEAKRIAAETPETYSYRIEVASPL